MMGPSFENVVVHGGFGHCYVCDATSGVAVKLDRHWHAIVEVTLCSACIRCYITDAQSPVGTIEDLAFARTSHFSRPHAA